MWYVNLVITVLVEATPNHAAKTSEGTVLTTQLDIVLWLSMQLRNWFYQITTLEMLKICGETGQTVKS